MDMGSSFSFIEERLLCIMIYLCMLYLVYNINITKTWFAFFIQTSIHKINMNVEDVIITL